MRPQLKLSIALACGLAAATAAHAACDVTLSSVLANGQLVLSANCGAGAITGINWFRDTATITPGGVSLPSSVNNTPVAITTSPLGGAHSYTATGATGTNPADTADVAVGIPAVVITPLPTLTVAPTAGGTVAANPAGTPAITVCAYNNPDVNCSAAFAPGTTVQLTATADGTHSFSGWSGDCAGSGTKCAVSMTTSRIVSANFGDAQVTGACGSASSTTAVASAPATNLCTTGAATGVATPTGPLWKYTWGCNGANGGGSVTDCAVPAQLAGTCGSMISAGPQSSMPSANLCGIGTPGSVIATTAVPYQFQWTCAGPNGGGNSPQCTVAQVSTLGACATITNTITNPPSTAGCSAGTVASLVSPSTAGGTYTWNCTGLAGGNPQNGCTANQTVNGACGTASGSSFSTAPSSNLCVAGTTVQTAPSGAGPWHWGCNGVNNGTNMSTPTCTASGASAGSCAATPAGITVQTWSGYANSSSVITQVIPAGAGIALQFTMSQSAYPYGFQLSDQGSGTKTYSFSRCPGGTDAAILGQDGTISVNGDATFDNCINVAGGYMRPANTSGATPAFYTGARMSSKKTCFLPTTTTQGGSTPATYYLNIINNSTTSDAGIQYQNLMQLN